MHAVRRDSSKAFLSFPKGSDRLEKGEYEDGSGPDAARFRRLRTSLPSARLSRRRKMTATQKKSGEDSDPLRPSRARRPLRHGGSILTHP